MSREVKNLRKLARGRACAVRLPGCLGASETVVLAHYRLSGLCGAGLKPSDLLGAWTCAPCHDAVDGRRQIDMPRDLVRLCHAEGVIRTLAALEREGVI